MRPVDVAFVAEAVTVATILPCALARVEGAYYSVPCRWAGLDLTTWIGATSVTLVGPTGERWTVTVHDQQQVMLRTTGTGH